MNIPRIILRYSQSYINNSKPHKKSVTSQLTNAINILELAIAASIRAIHPTLRQSQRCPSSVRPHARECSRCVVR